MNVTKVSLVTALTSIISICLAGMLLHGAPQTTSSDQSSSMSSSDSTEAKIARAMSADPASVANAARIVDTDTQGNKVVVRKGNNDFICVQGNPRVIGKPPTCADAAAMQWSADFEAHKAKPTNTEPGIVYMLPGATQRSDTDLYDTSSPPIRLGPHWMILWPFDSKTTGLPTTHKSTGAYIMWAGPRYAHVHIMRRP